jgi:TolC family type I secretion outer membrane protein
MGLRTALRVGALLLCIGSAGPAAAQVNTLSEALASAYLSNPTLDAERARVRATDENVTQALSLTHPSANAFLSAGAGMFENDFNVRSTSENRTPASAEVEVRQPVYRGGSIDATIERSENEVMAARATLLSVEQEIMFDAGSAYMNVLRDKAIVDLRVNNESVLRRQLQATRDRFQVGEVTRTDVSQAEARLSQATADRRAAEGDLASSRANFEQLIGQPPGDLRVPDTLFGLPSSQQTAVEQGGINNPNVIRAVFTHLAAVKDVRNVRGELLPSVDVVGRAGYGYEESTSDTNSSSAEALVQVTVPLYSSGSVRSRVRQAKQSASQRLVEIEQARRDAIETATIAWARLQSTRSTIDALRDQIRANDIALEGVQQEALVGTRTVLDVLDAEQELLDARVNLVISRRDELVAQLALAAAVGRLTAKPLELDVPYYDVQEHYQKVRGRWFGTDVDEKWKPTPNR